MPTYDYHCRQCGHQLELFQKISDAPEKICPQCGHETLQRGPGGGVGLSFSGPGFYINDYAPGAYPKKPGCCPCNKTHSQCTKPKTEEHI